MRSALVYLCARSLGNMLAAQWKRLKKPQYLAAALLGTAYLGFFLLRPFVLSHSQPNGPSFPSFVDGRWLETMGAVLVALYVAFCWLVPRKRALLDFTEAEIAFLFPAPLSRRQLIGFKLVKSQLKLMPGALLMTLLCTRSEDGWRSVALVFAWWLALMVLEFHAMVASFVRTLWLDSGIAGRRRLWVARAGAALIIVGLFSWILHARNRVDVSWGEPEFFQSWGGFLSQDPFARLLLWPFRILVRPFTAVGWLPLVGALLTAAIAAGIHAFWILRCDVAFEEAALARAREKAQAVALMQAGRSLAVGALGRRAPAPFSLAPTGPRFVALFWKNLVAALALFNLRFWLIVLAGLVLAMTLLRFALPQAFGDWGRIAGIFLIGLSPLIFIMGPFFAQFDLRQNLALTDLLKTYPLPGWQIVVGELMAPTLVLALVQGCCSAAILVLAPIPPLARIDSSLRLTLLGCLVVLLPAFNFLCLLVLNGAALLFPAWFRLVGGAGAGLEALGHRLLVMLGYVLVVGGGLLFPAGAFMGLFALLRPFTGLNLALCPASLVALILLSGELGYLVFLLGKRFEEMDVATES